MAFGLGKLEYFDNNGVKRHGMIAGLALELRDEEMGANG